MGLAVAGMSVAVLTRDEPPCAYVLAQADTAAVATPAVVVLDSPEESGAQPLRVHLDEEGHRCESLGVSTPAVAIHVSRSAFLQPGALQETPTIALLLPDRVWSAPGHILSLPGSTLVLPAQKPRDVEPLWPVTEPYLSVDIGGELRTVRLLSPRPEPAAHSSALPSD